MSSLQRGYILCHEIQAALVRLGLTLLRPDPLLQRLEPYHRNGQQFLGAGVVQLGLLPQTSVDTLESEQRNNRAQKNNEELLEMAQPEAEWPGIL